MDPLVKVTGYSDGFDFKLGALPRAAAVATFYVGDYGPFTVRVPQGATAGADIQTAIQAKVNELRAAGIVT